jgi:hypothetical protein
MLHVHRNCFLNSFYAQNSIITLITTSCWNFNGLYTRINDILNCSMRQIITIFDVHLNASLIWQTWLSPVRLCMILFSLSLCYKLFQLVLNTELPNFTPCIAWPPQKSVQQLHIHSTAKGLKFNVLPMSHSVSATITPSYTKISQLVIRQQSSEIWCSLTERWLCFWRT